MIRCEICYRPLEGKPARNPQAQPDRWIKTASGGICGVADWPTCDSPSLREAA